MNPARRALNFVLRAALTALVLAPLAAPGQNLGRLALLSRLGEPLDAEIEVTAVPVEARDSLSAQIVPIGVFERFGVTPSPSLEVLRAAVERSAERLRQLEGNLDRLKLKAELVCTDAAEWQPPTPADAVLLATTDRRHGRARSRLSGGARRARRRCSSPRRAGDFLHPSFAVAL